ncbi:MAG: ABC transporter substrate-binding protein [Verrucomicrobia bacterium]|nr:ABC transporter substrate-binding protein [Verrucomicrobiota bacterium]
MILFAGSTVLLYSYNKYAENFEIETFETHRLLHIKNPWRGSGDTRYSYALVDKGRPVPELPKGARVIRTPVERIIIMATVYLGPIQSLDMYDQLVGAAHLELSNDPFLQGLVDSGKVQAIQSGASLDLESILLLRPDLILSFSTGESLYDTHPKLERANLPVVLTSGYMEADPLARSEWIKAIASFVNKEAQAEIIFADIADRYEKLKELTSKVVNRPTVFANAPFAGVWHLPGGQSYNSRAFNDAGASYLWADDSSLGGVPLDFEVILIKAANADIWINPGSYETLDALLGHDERFTAFRAFREAQVFNNIKRVNKNGGNDMWERGINHPDEVLADLIKIFHPELLPEHEFIYYEQLK